VQAQVHVSGRSNPTDQPCIDRQGIAQRYPERGTIYAAIYAQPKGGLKTEMIAALRQHKPARGLRRTTLAGGSIAPESLRIIHRPEEIEARLVPGHWEGDLIKGAFNRSVVGTVVERKTRFVIFSSSSVKQSIRGIDCSAERAVAPQKRRWRGFHDR